MLADKTKVSKLIYPSQHVITRHMCLKTKPVKQTVMTRLTFTYHIQNFALIRQSESETSKPFKWGVFNTILTERKWANHLC